MVQLWSSPNIRLKSVKNAIHIISVPSMDRFIFALHYILKALLNFEQDTLWELF